MADVETIYAIDYNYWQTLIKLLKDKLPDIVIRYGINCDSINILPAYPRDITNMSKPSIIIRKVDSSQSKLSMDNFIGQAYDEDSNLLYDVYGIEYDIMYQFDVLGNSNTQTQLLIASLFDLINDIIICNAGEFTLYDFTGDRDNPVECGKCVFYKEPKVINLSSIIIGLSEPNNNNDYLSLLRQSVSIVQTIVPKQEFVDLSKWVKQNIKIKGDDING